jgi:tRNA pseudouridine synthase 10
MYTESVEEIIVEPMLAETGGVDAAFHAAGREDVDVRMLGTGRPFIVEIKKPKRRFLDLPTLAPRVNAQKKVKVSNLCFSRKEHIRKLKNAEKSNKVYKATVLFDRPISPEKVRVVETVLTNAIVYQQTPLRVLHRRADRLREKRIYTARIKRLAPSRVDLRIHCDGGLYIKELITGDDGRTDPCVSKLVNAEVKTLELDVLDVITREF